MKSGSSLCLNLDQEEAGQAVRCDLCVSCEWE